MQLLKTLVLSVAAFFSFLQPHPAVPAKNQVLGEKTAQQVTEKKEKPETVAGAPGGEDVNPEESSSKRSAPNAAGISDDNREEPHSSSSSVPESETRETVSYDDLKQLTATNPAALKRQLEYAYSNIQKSKAANKAELLQKLYGEYRTAIAHEEDHISATAGTVDSTTAEEKSKDAQEKEQFKARLAHIRDEKKKQVVENIDSKITAINYKAVELMNSALNKLSKLLTSLNNQIFALKIQSPDILKIQTDSLDAQAAITDAQQAVLDQANKSYILPISSDESKLKGEIGPVVSSLRNDIAAAHKKVLAAKEAVSKVYTEVYQLKLKVTPKVTLETATGEGVPVSK